MCISVVTDYWEIVSYPLTNIKKILNNSAQQEEADGEDVSVESLHGGKVILIQEGKDTKQIMVQMHAGLWSICYDVAGDDILIYYVKY